MANHHSKYQLRRLTVLKVLYRFSFVKLMIISLSIFALTNCSTSPSQKAIDLPEMIINRENLDWHPQKVLSESEVEQLKVGTIDKLNEYSHYPPTEYYLLNTIYESDRGKILLLGWPYEMENLVWLVSYSPLNEIIDSKVVFYEEFAEGIKEIQSVIDKNQITISTILLNLERDEETIETMNFKINEQLKFIEIP